MSGKTFAQINCSLLRSKRLMDCTHAERWSYICAHLTPLGNFTGLFTYPAVMWAQNAAVSVEEIAGIAARLSALGLVEYDPDEELLRIVRLHRQRPPANASGVISLVNDFYGNFPGQGFSADMRLRTIAEFAVATVQRAQGWKPDSPDRAKVRETLKPFLIQEWQEGGDALVAAVRAELSQATQAARNEMQTFFPNVELGEPLDTERAPCGHGARIRDVDETRPIRDLKLDEYETDTAQKSDCDNRQGSGKADGLDLLRNGKSGDSPVRKPGPKEATRRSALANRA